MIILYCKTIHPVIFFQQHTFFIVYNIELIFANTSIIEYWFFFARIAPPVYFYCFIWKKITSRTSMISVLFRKKNYSKIKVYCKQNRHFYRDFFEGFLIFLTSSLHRSMWTIGQSQHVEGEKISTYRP